MILQGLFKSIAYIFMAFVTIVIATQIGLRSLTRTSQMFLNFLPVSVLDKINVVSFQIEYTESVKPYFDL